MSFGKKGSSSSKSTSGSSSSGSPSSPTDEDYKCYWISCGVECSSTGQLKVHLEDFHLGRGRSSYGCNWLGCKFGSCRKRDHMKSHFRKHHRHPEFMCPYCTRAFVRVQQRDSHAKKCAAKQIDAELRMEKEKKLGVGGGGGGGVSSKKRIREDAKLLEDMNKNRRMFPTAFVDGSQYALGYPDFVDFSESGSLNGKANNPFPPYYGAQMGYGTSPSSSLFSNTAPVSNSNSGELFGAVQSSSSSGSLSFLQTDYEMERFLNLDAGGLLYPPTLVDSSFSFPADVKPAMSAGGASESAAAILNDGSAYAAGSNGGVNYSAQQYYQLQVQQHLLQLSALSAGSRASSNGANSASLQLPSYSDALQMYHQIPLNSVAPLTSLSSSSSSMPSAGYSNGNGNSNGSSANSASNAMPQQSLSSELFEPNLFWNPNLLQEHPLTSEAQLRMPPPEMQSVVTNVPSYNANIGKESKKSASTASAAIVSASTASATASATTATQSAPSSLPPESSELSGADAAAKKNKRTNKSTKAKSTTLPRAADTSIKAEDVPIKTEDTLAAEPLAKGDVAPSLANNYSSNNNNSMVSAAAGSAPSSASTVASLKKRNSIHQKSSSSDSDRVQRPSLAKMSAATELAVTLSSLDIGTMATNPYGGQGMAPLGRRLSLSSISTQAVSDVDLESLDSGVSHEKYPSWSPASSGTSTPIPATPRYETVYIDGQIIKRAVSPAIHFLAPPATATAAAAPALGPAPLFFFSQWDNAREMDDAVARKRKPDLPAYSAAISSGR